MSLQIQYSNSDRGRQREKWVHYYVSLRCYNTDETNYNNKYNFSVIFE